MITANSHLEDSPNGLNASDSRHASKIDDIHERVIQSTDSKTAKQDCVHETLHSDHSTLRGSVGALRTDDVSPIKYARVRFLHLIIDHFIDRRIKAVPDSEADYNDTRQYEQDRLGKRKSRAVIHEGDPWCSNPLIYVENIYKTLVTEANARLACLDGFQQMTIGLDLDLDAAEGLYRRIAQVFPEEGLCKSRRREFITRGDASRWFPELVVKEEKEVRFVAVNGLGIVEKPETVSDIDKEWFMRLTGRSEASISEKDYKFYSPRHKNQLIVSNPLPSIPGLPPHVGTQNSSPMAIPHEGSSIPEVTLDEFIPLPLPPIHPLWADHHHTSVDGLDLLYADRIKRYEWFQTFM